MDQEFVIFVTEQYSTTVWTYHNLFIHEPVDGRLGCLHFFGYYSKAGMNTGVKFFLIIFFNGHILLFVFSKCLGVEWLDHIISVCYASFS